MLETDCELWWPNLDNTSLAGFPSNVPRIGGTSVVYGAGALSSDGVELLGAPTVMPRSPLIILGDDAQIELMLARVSENGMCC